MRSTDFALLVTLGDVMHQCSRAKGEAARGSWESSSKQRSAISFLAVSDRIGFIAAAASENAAREIVVVHCNMNLELDTIYIYIYICAAKIGLNGQLLWQDCGSLWL